MAKQSKTPISTRNKYTAEHREKARKYYLMGLNLHEIGLLLGGCPIRTLEKWQSSEQWTKFKQLENIEIKAYELHNAGKSYNEIAQMLNISSVTVWRYIKKTKDSQNVKLIKPRKYTKTD